MSNREIQNLLAKLEEEIQTTKMDAETQAMARQLDSDIQDLLDEDSDQTDAEPVLTRARTLEATFATDHPVSERFVREVINMLARMGI